MSFEEIEIPIDLHRRLHALWERLRGKEDHAGFDRWLDREMAVFIYEWEEHSWRYGDTPSREVVGVLVTAEVAFTLNGIAIASRQYLINVVSAVATRIADEKEAALSASR